MKYVTLSKKEMSVLTKVLGMHELPVNLADVPDIVPGEYSRLVGALSKQGVIAYSGSRIVPDDGFVPFLRPMSQASRVMLIDFGENDQCTFRVTLYFSDSGAVALVDLNEEEIRLLCLDSLEQLMRLLPDVRDMGRGASGERGYVSYILLEEKFSIVHCTRTDAAANTARVTEGKRMPGKAGIESEYVTEIPLYADAFAEKLKGVYDAAGC